ncbi:hypothetical protein PMZ80_011091 [Knufia obscura]|uniref:NmrA-like domain-containing protein n=2 Tax=Knufia TaxID=430999 RepID=A0AAN8E7J3_9EURO|nr:hypothetical protein PMZ80_011091 [Knufia obscura]KAK5947949.1 hypothetical protein OHC33_010990 [Knufia fluminis]
MASKDDLVVVTCASGKQGSHLVPLLHTHYRLRLVVNSSASATRLQQQYPSAEVVQADLAQPNDCITILDGATAVYHIGPPIHPHEKEIGYNMIDAAVLEAAKPSSSFAHFVFSSVLNTQLRKMYNHDDKRYIEEYLIESGLNFTILQPADFLDMTFVHLIQQSRDPSVQLSWKSPLGPESKSSLVTLKDLGEAGAKVIGERERHYQSIYPLVSIGPIFYREAVRRLADTIGRNIEIEDLSLEERANFLCTLIFGSVEATPVRSRDKAERLVLFYQRRGLQGNKNVLEWLLGRESTDIETWASNQLKAEV